MRPQRYLVLLTFLLATLSAVSGQTPTDSVRFDPPPGSYPQSIDVSVSKSSEDVASSRLWYRFAEDRDTSFIAAGAPIPLSAIPGATLDYTIELAVGEPGGQEIVARAQYRLDAEVPPPPVPDPVPGVYKGAVDLKLRSEEGASVRYLFARSASEPQRYSGPLRLNAPPGERSEYTVIAVAEDAAGNLSEVFEGRYVVDGTGVPQAKWICKFAVPCRGSLQTDSCCSSSLPASPVFTTARTAAAPTRPTGSRSRAPVHRALRTPVQRSLRRPEGTR